MDSGSKLFRKVTYEKRKLIWKVSGISAYFLEGNIYNGRYVKYAG